MNTGTIPSKTLRETAHYFSGLRQRGLYGVDLRVKPDITIADFMRRERCGDRDRVEPDRREPRAARHHHASRARRTSSDRAHGGGRRATASRPRRVTGAQFLLAPGCTPRPPQGYAVDGEVVVDSESLLTLQKIPASMIVVGGGVDRVRVRVHLRRARRAGHARECARAAAGTPRPRRERRVAAGDDGATRTSPCTATRRSARSRCATSARTSRSPTA